MFSWFSFYLRYLYDVKSWIFCFIFGSRTLERQYPTRRRQIYGQYRAGRWQGNSNLNNLSSRQLKFSHQTINKTFEKVCISLCLRFAKLAKGITVMTTTIFSKGIRRCTVNVYIFYDCTLQTSTFVAKKSKSGAKWRMVLKS